jgi:hypothetical protein
MSPVIIEETMLRATNGTCGCAIGTISSRILLFSSLPLSEITSTLPL